MTGNTDRFHECILVIDDGRDIVLMIKGNLELDGYDVLYAFDGKTDLHITKTTRPDLIIPDLNLPEKARIIL